MIPPVKNSPAYQVGQIYTVKIARFKAPIVKLTAHKVVRLWWLPIIGQAHSDGEVAGLKSFTHYNVDGRFLNTDAHPDSQASFNIVVCASNVRTIEEKSLICVNDMRRFDPFASHLIRQHCAKLDLRCDGNVCPHKGISLKECAVEYTNAGEPFKRCPGHGLLWSLETGKLIEY